MKKKIELPSIEKVKQQIIVQSVKKHKSALTIGLKEQAKNGTISATKAIEELLKQDPSVNYLLLGFSADALLFRHFSACAFISFRF
jgi:hypothetical protein